MWIRGIRLGAVLLQESNPIAYFSKTLGVRAMSKSIYEKELMAMVLAVQKWRHYLMGKHFIIHSDQGHNIKMGGEATSV